MIRIIYLIIFFVLGTLMGSFYTVVGSRLPKGESFITGRSHCEHCKNKLSLLDMIPIISYLFLRGRCRYCNSKIDSLSTWMELFTGLLFSLSYFTFGFSYELLFALGIRQVGAKTAKILAKKYKNIEIDFLDKYS